MNSLTLYQLADEYRALMEMSVDPEADADSFGAALEALGGDFEQKAVAVAQVALNLEGFYAQVLDAVKAMEARADRAKERAKSIREFLKTQMEKTGITKIESPYFRMTVRNNPPRVVIDEEALIPKEYLRHVPERFEQDKTAIARALKSGVEIDGCRLESSTRLEIR